MWSEEFEPYAITIGILVLYAVLEWARTFVENWPSPWIFTGFAVVGVMIGVRRFRQMKRRSETLKLGIEGELAVGQFLEALRCRGAEVFHDVPGNGFNVDHVVMDSTGIYAIETKTWSKPSAGRAVIEFDGEEITKMGLSPDRCPIVQARAGASYIGQILEESTGKKFPVRPVVLFPGWFIEQTKKGGEVWALNPKAFEPFLEKQVDRVEPSDVKLAAFHLARILRARARV